MRIDKDIKCKKVTQKSGDRWYRSVKIGDSENKNLTLSQTKKKMSKNMWREKQMRKQYFTKMLSFV